MSCGVPDAFAFSSHCDLDHWTKPLIREWFAFHLQVRWMEYFEPVTDSSPRQLGNILATETMSYRSSFSAAVVSCIRVNALLAGYHDDSLARAVLHPAPVVYDHELYWAPKHTEQALEQQASSFLLILLQRKAYICKCSWDSHAYRQSKASTHWQREETQP